MGLPEIYEKYFGTKEAAEKKAEGEEAAQAAEAQATETAAPETATEAAPEISDEDLETALGQMSEDDLKALATEVAGDVKASQEKERAEEEKVAEEYYAAGRIFAQGFMAEVKGEKTAAPAQTATQKFAAMLEAELQKGAEKKAEPAKK